MNRLKKLTLLTVAVLALTGAIGATGASASGFVTYNENIAGSEKDEYPATYKGENTEYLRLGFGGTLEYNCENIPVSGNLPSAMRMLTPAPQANSLCDATAPWYWQDASFKWNNCSLVYHTGTETSANHFAGTFDIGGAKCTTGPTVAYTPGINPGCTVTYPPQTGLKAEFINSGGEGNKAVVEVKLLGTPKYTAAGGALGCPKGETGFWTATYKLSAYNEASSQIGLITRPYPAMNIHTAGGQLLAEDYPLMVAGDQVSPLVFASKGGGSTKCTRAHMSFLLSSAISAITPDSEFAGCTVTLLGVPYPETVNMNSCDYVLNLGGTLDVSCSSPGDSINILKFNSTGTEVKCTYRIPAQKGLSGLTYTGSSQVTVGFSVSGVTYTSEGGIGGCGMSAGTYTNGSYTGSILLIGGTE